MTVTCTGLFDSFHIILIVLVQTFVPLSKVARFRLEAIDNDKFGAPNYCGQLLDTIDAEHKASMKRHLF